MMRTPSTVGLCLILPLAVLVAIPLAGCNRGGGRAAAERFLDAHYVRIDLDAARGLSSGLARAKLDKELALTADVSIEADTRQPRINYQLETAREDGDRGQFAYVLTIRAAGAEPFEKLVTVTVKQDDSGDWSVTNYTDGDRSIAP